MKLSICICSLACRSTMLKCLLEILQPQVDAAPGEVELLIEADAGEVPIGAKRNKLVARAAGDFICFVDDDDLVSGDYVARILEAADYAVDCVGFRGMRTVDGKPDGQILYSLKNARQGTRKPTSGNPARHLRPPNHLCPIRADIVRLVPFQEINAGEDTDYATRINPYLKKEAFIDDVLYHYQYRSPAARHETTNMTRRTDPAVGATTDPLDAPLELLDVGPLAGPGGPVRVVMTDTLATSDGLFTAGATYSLPRWIAQEWIERQVADFVGEG